MTKLPPMTSYRNTLFLPRTDFPIRAELPQNEPKRLKNWQKRGLDRLFANKSADSFVLHDGPPYANGDIHMGHALNKILKDIVNRIRLTSGKKVDYIPGWDCHGLPIEWEVEKEWRRLGKDKSKVSEFRADCRKTAAKWVKEQSTQFRRLGVGGEWQKPYTTMTPAAEAAIAEGIFAFMERGLLYHQTKPVLWSVVERTALAEAEVEYKDKRSWSILVEFAIKNGEDSELEGAKALIWTTTPWTIPANCAVCVGNHIDYLLVFGKDGSKLMLAENRLSKLKEQLGISPKRIKKLGKGKSLAGKLTLTHPLHGKQIPLLGGDFVKDDEGSGLVHIAPEHGPEDYRLAQSHGLEGPKVINEDGIYLPHVETLAGAHIFDADEKVVEILKQKGRLRRAERITHSYPHSWRSGKPLIYLSTPQWFIDLKKSGILKAAEEQLNKVKWYPPAAKRRMEATLRDRPDWCLSRQRSWGVPLAFFIKKGDGKPLTDDNVNRNILKIFAEEGSDAWFERPSRDFLANTAHKAEDCFKVKDVADVWFDSGLTHSFVLNSAVADLYLEGSDQHRGWFQSSLLTSVALRKMAPYKAALTHGFILDENGRKMSKSRGNVVSPRSVIERYGAEPMRLWVAMADYRGDLKLGKNALAEAAELYRRIRNTWRFLLGSLAHFPQNPKRPADPPFIERWVFHRLAELESRFKRAGADLLFHTFYRDLHEFCNGDLSAFYFEIIKDSLYCDPKNSKRRLAAGAAMTEIFIQLCRWFSAVLCFTADEAWQSRFGKNKTAFEALDSIKPPSMSWFDPKLKEQMAELRKLRGLIFTAIEKQKAEYPSTLQARLEITAPPSLCKAAEPLDLAAFALVAEAEMKEASKGEGVTIKVSAAEGKKCPRCWQYKLEVKDEDCLCSRCKEAIIGK